MLCCAARNEPPPPGLTGRDASMYMGTGVYVGAQYKRVCHAARTNLTKREDAILVAELDELAAPGTASPQLFAVFDGHGGPQAAQYCATHMKSLLLQAYNQSDAKLEVHERYAAACKAAFARANAELAQQGIPDGTTATVVIVNGDQIVAANVGDSHCYFFPGSAGSEPQRLTADHRVEAATEAELSRVKNAGGRIARATASDGKTPIGPERLYPGGLMMTRSLGDADSSKAAIPEPEVSTLAYPVDGGTLVLASDGIWDFLDVPRVGRLVDTSRTGQPRLGPTWLAKATITATAEKNQGDDDVSLVCVRLGRPKKRRTLTMRLTGRSATIVFRTTTGSSGPVSPSIKDKGGTARV